MRAPKPLFIMGNAMMRCGLHVVTDEALDEARDDLASMNKKCLHSYTRVLLYQLREMVLIEQQARHDARRDQSSMVSP